MPNNRVSRFGNPSRGRGRSTRRVSNGPRQVNVTYNQSRPRRFGGRRPGRQGKPLKPRSPVKNVKTKKEVTAKQIKIVASQLGRKREVIVTGLTQTQVNADVIALWNMIEHFVMDMFAITDIAEDSATYLWYYYFYYLFLLHIKRFGGLTGTLTGALTSNADHSTLSVPFAFAKYLEYLSPFENTVQLQSSYVFSTDLVPTNHSNMGAGNNITGISRVGLNNWILYNQSQGTNATTTSAPLVFRQLTATGVTFSSFLSDTRTISAMSNSLKGAYDCISLSDVPERAPDASAYGQANVQPNLLATQPNQINNFCGDFDPEVTLLMSISRTGTEAIYSDLHTKQFPVPFYTLQGVPYYSQLVATWVYLARACRKTYAKGPIRRAFPFDGTVVRSLYRNRQYLNGKGLSNLVIEYYKQLLHVKRQPGNVQYDSADLTIVTPPDVMLRGFTYLMSMCFMCAQYYMNLHSIDGVFTPPYDVFTLGTVYAPQATYLEKQWGDVELPPPVAAFISGIAPVLVDGILRSPASEYQGKILNDVSGGIPGPLGWSAYGYSNDPDRYFDISNLMTTSLGINGGNAGAQANPPFVPLNWYNVDSGGQPVPALLDPSYITAYIGSFNNTVYSFGGWTTNGALGKAIQEGFNQWYLDGFNTSLPPLVKPENKGIGTPEVMTMHNISSSTDFGVPFPPYSLLADNIALPDGYPPQNLIQYSNTADLTLSSNEVTSDRAFLNTICPSAELTDQSNQPSALRKLGLQRKSFVLGGSQPPDPNSSQVTYSGNSILDPPTGSSGLTLISTFMRKFVDPSSPFNKELQGQLMQSPNLINLPKGVEGPTSYNLIRKYAAHVGQNLFDQQLRTNNRSYMLSGKEYTGKLAQHLRQLENTRGTKVEGESGPPKKENFMQKVMGFATKGLNVANSAVKVLGEGKKVADAIGSIVSE